MGLLWELLDGARIDAGREAGGATWAFLGAIVGNVIGEAVCPDGEPDCDNADSDCLRECQHLRGEVVGQIKDFRTETVGFHA